MDVLDSTAPLLLSLARTRQDESRVIRELSSGLRVQSSADDPSGLAISETTKSRVSGLQQGAQNAQQADNMLQVAMSAAQNIQSVLQRMYGLVVEAGSDLESLADLNAIQSELNSLAKEINSISEHASFNGVKLFDGSHDTYVGSAPGVDTPATVIMLDPPPNQDGSTPVSTVYDPQGMAAQFIQNARMDSSQEGEGYFLFQITGYSSNPTDPTFGPLGQPGVYLRSVGFSTDPAWTGKQSGPTETIDTQALPTGAGWDFSSGGSLYISNPGGWVGSFVNIALDMPNLSQQDVGVAGAFITIDAKQTAGGTALSVNTTGQEGGDIAVSLPTLNANVLDVSRLSVLPATRYDDYDNAIGQDSTNQYAVADSMARIKYAMDSVGQVLATLGAQSVAFQSESANNGTAVVNQVAAGSAIRDADMGLAATQLARDQILTQVSSSVLAQTMQSDSSLVLSLFR